MFYLISRVIHLVYFLERKKKLCFQKNIRRRRRREPGMTMSHARENKSAEEAEILSFKSADIKNVMKLRNKGEV